MSKLAGVIDQAARTLGRRLRVALPGRVLSYAAATQSATIEIQLEMPLPKIDARGEERAGEYDHEEFPRLHGVPLGHPRGGGFFVHFPLQAGDFVWVMFSDQSLDEFLRTGIVSKPQDVRTHDLFPYALPVSDPSQGGQLSSPSSTDLTIGREGGSEIRIKPNDEVHVAGGSDYVALAQKVEAQLQAIVDAITGAVPGVQDGGTQLQTQIVAALNDPVGSVAASKLKAT